MQMSAGLPECFGGDLGGDLGGRRLQLVRKLQPINKQTKANSGRSTNGCVAMVGEQRGKKRLKLYRWPETIVVFAYINVSESVV